MSFLRTTRHPSRHHAPFSSYGLDRTKSTGTADSGRQPPRILRGAVAIVAATAFAAVLLFVGGRESRLLGGSDRSDACRIEDRPSPERARVLVGTEPWAGSPLPRVEVLTLFDPSCKACSDVTRSVRNLVERYGNRARFTFKPVALTEASVDQVGALWFASDAGYFFEMMEAQFALGQSGHLTREDLVLLGGALGFDAQRLRDHLVARSYVQAIERERDALQAAGLESVPAVWIDGRPVILRTEECMSTLIRQAITRSASPRW